MLFVVNKEKDEAVFGYSSCRRLKTAKMQNSRKFTVKKPAAVVAGKSTRKNTQVGSNILGFMVSTSIYSNLL